LPKVHSECWKSQAIARLGVFILSDQKSAVKMAGPVSETKLKQN